MLPHVNDNTTAQQDRDAVRADKRNEQFDRIAFATSSASIGPVADDSVLKVVNSFSRALKETNETLLKNLVEEDKKLLSDVISELTTLQGKTSKDFGEKLDKSLKFAERLILRGESTNNPELKKTGEKLKETLFDEKFKAMGIDDDPTLGQRVRRRFFGENGEKNLGWVQGRSIFKNAGSALANSFSSQFMGGAFAGVTKTNEQRRAEIREQAELENKRIASLEESQQGLMGVLNNSGMSPAEDSVTSGGGEETTQLGSANISPDTRTKSDFEELRAGIRDTDRAFSRSSTLNSKTDDNWKKLLQLLEDIKKCVCECQCSGGGMNLPMPMPMPLPTRTPTATRAPVRVPRSVPVAVTRRVSVPALEATKMARPLALPAPAAVEAQGLARQITQARTSPAPALEYKPLNDTPLDFENQRVKEKVPVLAKAEPVYQAEDLSVAERLRRGIIGSADEAIRTFREERAAGKTIGTSEPAPPRPAETRPAETRPPANRRPNENITTQPGRENWRRRWAAQASENELLRRLRETQPKQRGTPSSTGTPGRSLVPVRTTGTPAPSVGMWERIKGAGSNALNKAKSLGSRLTRGFGSSFGFGIGSAAAQAADNRLENRNQSWGTTAKNFIRDAAVNTGVGHLFGMGANKAIGAATSSSTPWLSRLGTMAEAGSRYLGPAYAAYEAAKTMTWRIPDYIIKSAHEDASTAQRGIEQFGLRGDNMNGYILNGKNVGGRANLPEYYKNVVDGYGANSRGGSADRARQYVQTHNPDGTQKTPQQIEAARQNRSRQARAEPADSRNWWQRTMPNWMGGEDAPNARPSAARPSAAANINGGTRQPVAATSTGHRPVSSHVRTGGFTSDQSRGNLQGAGALGRSVRPAANPLAASVQSGQNQDSAIISRSTAAVATARGVAERPVINVPPPTVIQAPANNPTQLLPSTARSSRPEDSSWMQWQRKRASAMA